MGDGNLEIQLVQDQWLSPCISGHYDHIIWKYVSADQSEALGKDSL